MNNIFRYFFILCILFIKAQKNYIIEYQLDYKISNVDTTDIRTENFYLFVENGKSQFISVNNYIADSIAHNAKSIAAVYSMPMTKFKNSIIKNFNSNKFTYQQNFGIERFKYKRPLPDLNWKLSSEKDSVFHLKCNKAYTSFAGRNYQACYSSDIAISDGPYKFYGLPGLILKLEDTEKDYIFQFKSIKKYNHQTVEKYKEEYKEISYKEFKEYLLKLRLNPSLQFNNNKIQFPPEALRKVNEKQRERQKYENNPIELIDE